MTNPDETNGLPVVMIGHDHNISIRTEFPGMFPLLMFAIPVLSADPTPEDAKLVVAFRQYLDAEFQRHPVFASSQGNHDHDDRLDDLSPTARTEDDARTTKLLAELPTRIDRSKLSRSGQIDYDIWTHALKYQLWQSANDNRFETDPRVYGEYFTDSVFSLFSQSTVAKDRNVINAAKRITYIPQVLSAAKQSLKNPPKVLTEIALKRTAGAITFYEKDIFTSAGVTPGTGELSGPCKQAVTALKDYQRFLETELLPRSNGDWRLGKAKFAKKLDLELDAGLTADEVITEAESEAVRVEAEMHTIAVKLWPKRFADKPMPADRRAVIVAVLDELGKDHSTPATFVADARQTVERIKTFIREKGILPLPDPDRCQIIEMPEFQRGFSAAYLSPAPPLDPTAPSLYAVAPPPTDWPKDRQTAFFQEYNRAMLQILTIHEAYPGHYVQLEYGNRHPSLIRKVFYSGVFAEGWAVYTEKMMLDNGYGDGDLSLRLHQLKFYLRAVLNAILDHHMHCSNWTDEQALALLVGRGFQTEGEAVGKIQRAKQSSCQLSTYFVGRMAFHRLRQTVQAARGADFNLSRYHVDVLGHGTLPVKYLPELVK